MKLNLKLRPLPLLLYAYMALPFIIFAFFMKLYIAIPAAAVVAFSAYLAAADSEAFNKFRILPSDIPKIVTGCLFIIAIVTLSGIGGVLWQNQDHPYRNAIFNILTEKPWPPTGENASGSAVGLCYYIGFWLPAAAFGKLTTLSAGYFFQIVWAALGIGLIWLLICSLRKKVVLFPLIIVMLFSGLDVVGHFIVTHFFEASSLQMGNWPSFGNIPSFAYHLEWWGRYFQFSSHITQLFWVFNQSLPVWISTLVLICEKNNRNLVFIMGLTLLSSTLPFIGLIPVFLWCAFTKHNDTIFERPFIKNIDTPLFALFTPQNIFGGGISGIISFLYLKGNIASSSTGSPAPKSASAFAFLPFALMLVLLLFCFAILYKKAFTNPAALTAVIPIALIAYKFAGLTKIKMQYYLLFIILELIVIAALIFPRFGQTSVYYITVFSLMLIPFFKVGKSIDFCMRASIPALFILSLMASFSLSDYLASGKKVLSAVLIAVLVIGAVTPMHEIVRTVTVSSRQMAENGKITNKTKPEQTIFNGANFTAKTDGGVFYKYLAKDSKE